MDTTHFLLPLARAAALIFVAGLWQGLAAVVVIALCLRLLPRLAAAARFAIWACAFALLAAIPLLPLAASTRPHLPSATVHVALGWGIAIAALWAALTTLRLARLAHQLVHLRRIWRNATPVTSALSIHCRRHATLCTSPDVDAPSVIGFFSPRLLIPAWMFAQLSIDELRHVVLHECEHLRRRDDWVNLLQKIALALFPLNPALLWVDRRLGLERELACDAGVIASIAAPFAYAHCLTRLAEQRLVRRPVALALSIRNSHSELAHRIHSLLRPTRNVSPLYARLSVALLILGLTAGAAEMARAPRFVSFDPSAAPLPPTLAASVPPTAPATHATRARFAQPRQPVQQRPRLLTAGLTQAAPRPMHPHRQPRLLPASATQTVTHAQPRATGPAEARLVYAFIDLSPSYAAVPFGNGWLLVQL